VKTGVHMNWDCLPVDQIGAVSIREHLLKVLGESIPSENWEDIVDSSVYGNPKTGTKGSGFRLPWSHKKGRHVVCSGKGCTSCENSGKVTEVDYLPLYRYNGGLLTSVVSQRPSVELLKAATVRTNRKEPVTITPIASQTKINKREGKFTRDQTKNEVTDHEITEKIETFIRTHLEGQSEARVNKLFRHDEVYLVGTTSSYCENLGRPHNSNHVWFLVDETSVRQKCFCKCETLQGRKNGFCKDFTGRVRLLPPSLSNVLFPNKKADKIKAAIRPNVLTVRDTPCRSSGILLAKQRLEAT